MSKAKLRTPLRFRACAVCVRGSHRGPREALEILLVRMIDPHSQFEFWVPPGGGVESEETGGQTALRETLEETGEAMRLLSPRPISLRYDFNWNGQIHDCQTDFFLCEPLQPRQPPKIVQDAPYLAEARWFPFAEAFERLKFHDGICGAVKEVLAALGTRH